MPSFINECAEVQKGEVSHLKSPCGSSLAQIQVLITREITKFLPLKVVIKCPLSPGLLSHNMGHSMVQGLGAYETPELSAKKTARLQGLSDCSLLVARVTLKVSLIMLLTVLNCTLASSLN